MPKLFVIALVTTVACRVAFAQDSSSKPSFDVVSIRPGNGQPTTLPNGMRVLGAMQGGPESPDPERLTGNSVSLKSLMLRAYAVKSYQISGPSWIDTTRYDIAAKIPPGATKNDLNLMLQQMLEERFSLKLHHESKAFSAYNLVVAKNGLKLRDSVSTNACAAGARPAGGTCAERVSYQSGIMSSTSKDPGRLMTVPQGSGRIATGLAMPISALASMLEQQLAGPVVIDKTGLTGVYDFRLEFASPTITSQDDTPLPSLFTALEKDLGLKLESTKTPIDVLVIDHIERPSEN